MTHTKYEGKYLINGRFSVTEKNLVSNSKKGVYPRICKTKSMPANTTGLSKDGKKSGTLESIFHTFSKCADKATMDTYMEMRSSETYILSLT